MQGLGLFYTVAAGLLLTPLMLRSVPTEEYGLWLAIGNVITWLTAIDPGLGMIVQQRVAEAFGSRDAGLLANRLRIGLRVAGIVALLFLTLAAPVAVYPEWFLPGNLPVTVEFRAAVALNTLAAGGVLFSFGIIGICQGLQGARAVATIVTAANTLSFVATLIMLLQGAGLLGLGVGQATRGIVLIAGGSGYLRFRIRREQLMAGATGETLSTRAMLVDCLSNGGAKFVAALGSHSEAFLVTATISPATATALSLMRRFPDACRLLLDRPVHVLGPTLGYVAQRKEGLQASEIAQNLLRISVFMLGAAEVLVLSCNREFISLWVGHEFFLGEVLSQLVGWSVILGTIGSVMINTCVFNGHIVRVNIISVVTGVASLLICVLALLVGGVMAFVIAQLVVALAQAAVLWPWVMIRLRVVSSTAFRQLLPDTWRMLAITIIVATLARWMPALGWFALVGKGLAVALVYTVLQLALSRDLRAFACNVVRWALVK